MLSPGRKGEDGLLAVPKPKCNSMGEKMGFSLFPRNQKFFKLFEKQHSIVQEAVEALNQAFLGFPQVAGPCKSIHDLEHKGDEVFHEIIRELSQTFITPLDREDIHDINVTQEAVLNAVASVATRLGLYKPAEIRKGGVELTDNFCRIVRETGLMLVCMNENRGVDEQIQTIRKLKQEIDLFVLVDLGELFEQPNPDAAAAFETMKWDQIYTRIEDGIDKAVYLAHVIEGVCIKNG
jgi:uncharacterized protein